MIKIAKEQQNLAHLYNARFFKTGAQNFKKKFAIILTLLSWNIVTPVDWKTKIN